MPDYKAMYYYLKGRSECVDAVLDATTKILKITTEVIEANSISFKNTSNAVTELKETLGETGKITEEIFSEEEELEYINGYKNK